MKKRRMVVTIDPEVWERLRETCDRIHNPRPNLSAAVQEAVVLWLDLKREKAESGPAPHRSEMSKPAIRLCRGEQFGMAGCDSFTWIPPHLPAAPCRHCGTEVKR
jgi:hypothetical protein